MEHRGPQRASVAEENALLDLSTDNIEAKKNKKIKRHSPQQRITMLRTTATTATPHPPCSPRAPRRSQPSPTLRPVMTAGSSHICWGHRDPAEQLFQHLFQAVGVRRLRIGGRWRRTGGYRGGCAAAETAAASRTVGAVPVRSAGGFPGVGVDNDMGRSPFRG